MSTRTIRSFADLDAMQGRVNHQHCKSPLDIAISQDVQTMHAVIDTYRRP